MSLLLLPWAPNNGLHQPQQGVQYENLGSGADVSSASSMTWTHYSDGGNYCACLIGFQMYYTAGAPSLTATYGGVPFPTSWGKTYYNVSGTSLFVGMFATVGFPAGSTPIALTATGGTVAGMDANSLTYQNCAYGTLGVTKSATSTAASTAATPSGYGLCEVGVFSSDFTSTSLTNFSGNLRFTVSNSGNPVFLMGDAFDTSGSYSFTATCTPSRAWGSAAVTLYPPVSNWSLSGPKGRDPSTAVARASTR